MNARLDPVGKLGPEPWLHDPESVAVMDALEAGGADVRFVGGCVRDALAHRPVSDIDIATPEAPETVLQRLAAAGIRAIPTGLDHGTVSAVTGNRTFEITTLRKDVETDGRRAVVAYTEDWIVDSSRRDFTINALSANRNGDVYDYHEGIPDLAHGRIRFIGRAEARIEEDYLRILRFFRFYGLFGRPPYDVAAFNACRKHAEHLKKISAERIRHELLRTLMSPDPADVFLLMKNAHVLETVLPEATDIGRLRATAWLTGRALVIDGLEPAAIRHLGAALNQNADIGTVASRLRLSNREAARLADMATLAPKMATPLSIGDTRRLINKHNGEAVADAVILAWAARLSDLAKLPASESEARRQMLETALNWEVPALPITGNDAQALGVPHGPEIGNALRHVEDWWAKGNFKAGREDCLAELEKFVTGKK